VALRPRGVACILPIVPATDPLDRDAPGAAPRPRARRWLAALVATPRRIAVILFTASLLLRAAVAVEMAGTPLFRHAEWRETDNSFFVAWAGRIANGDWLGRTPIHPYHSWHAAIARHWARAQGVPFTDEVGRQRWNEWYGGQRFHQEPLYPYLLAVARAVAGDVRWVLLLQVIAGALTTALLFGIGYRLQGTATGVTAAVLHLAYGPMAYYDLMLHRTSLEAFGGVLTVWAVLRAWDLGRQRDFAVLGAILGATMLLASTAQFTLGILLAVLLVRGRPAGRRRESVRRALLVAGAAALVVSPAVLRNVALGVPPLELSSVAAITFIDANASDVDPAAGFVQSQHATDIMAETDGHLGAAVWATLAMHTGAGWPVMVARKLAYFFTPVEIPNNDSYAYYAGYSRLLRMTGLGFGLLGPLIAMGIGAGIMHRRRAWPVLLQVGIGLGLTLLFYDLSRFRAPVAAAALPLAALAIVELAHAVRRRRVAPVLLMVGLAAAPPIALHLAGPTTALPIRADDVAEGARIWQALVREAPTSGQAEAVATRALCDGPRLDSLLGDASPWSVAGRALVTRSLADIQRSAVQRGAVQSADSMEVRRCRGEVPTPRR